MVGLACHIGSQITNLDSFKETAQKTFELADQISEIGISLDFLDLGGGLVFPMIAILTPILKI